MWQHLASGVLRRQSLLRSCCRVMVAQQQQRSFVVPTLSVGLAAKTISVPTMGDSITEGTVVEWMVEPGQAVQPDDVVAMVETDKVTIEIKADISGVVTKHFSEVDETVEVGAPLYEIDTEATASVEASSKASDAAPPSSPKEDEAHKVTDEPVAAGAAAVAAKTTSSSPAPQHRTPLIQFLGKEGWAARLRVGSEVVELPPIHPMYGRPAFTDEEMEAIMLGGAEQAPKIVKLSSGATFA